MFSPFPLMVKEKITRYDMGWEGEDQRNPAVWQEFWVHFLGVIVSCMLEGIKEKVPLV